MKKLIAAALLLLSTLTTGAYAIDLTPLETSISSDGPPVKRYYFQDLDKRFAFRIDSAMKVTGTRDLATFRFTDSKTAGMQLSRSQMNPALPFDDKNLETYRAAARTFIPVDAANVQLEEEKPDAIAINDWTSHQFIFTYKLFGFPYRCAVTFINFGANEQIVFDLSATAPDYEKAYSRGFRVLNSLYDLPLSSKPGPT